MMEIIDRSDALFNACEKGHLSEVKRRIRNEQLEKPLNAACRNGHMDVIWLLLQKGANLHHSDEAPLRWAVVHNRIEVVELLLQRGADVHANNEHPLAIAVQMRHMCLIEMLLRWGARPTELVIRMARHYGHDDIALKLEHGTRGHPYNGTQP